MGWRGLIVAGLAIGVSVFGGSDGAKAQALALDPVSANRYSVISTDYKLSAKIDKRITPHHKTELWARIHFPKNTPAKSKLPLVIMLHGEHGTCGRKVGNIYIDDRANYTNDGTCPSGYRVTPNHWGYDYIGEKLAALGYIAVSINSNRGINQTPDADPTGDNGNVLVRGRLILAHLELLKKWNSVGGPTSLGFKLQARIDFSKVALMGHSRGGDAIVAAWRLKSDTTWKPLMPSNLAIKVLVSIAPTDRQRLKSPVKDVAHAVLLPLCDADLARQDGLRFFDRMAVQAPGLETANVPRWTFSVEGANHNGYNTEWLTDDAFDFGKTADGVHECPRQTIHFPKRGAAPAVMNTGLYFALAAIRGRIENEEYAQLLDPAYRLPPGIGAVKIDRGMITNRRAGQGRLLNAMGTTGPNGCAARVFTTVGAIANCGQPPEHQGPETTIARVRWGAPATSTKTNSYAKFKFNDGAVVDFTKFKSLEMRVAPDCVLTDATHSNRSRYRCSAPSLQVNNPGSQDVLVILQDQAGTYSNYINLSKYMRQREAVGLKVDTTNMPIPFSTVYHANLATARIPLSVFSTGNTINMSKVTTMWVFLSYTGGRGGLFFGQTWLSTAFAPVVPGGTAVDARMAPPLPPGGPLALQPGSELVADEASRAADIANAPSAADPGNAIHDVTIAGARGGARVARVTVSTGSTMIETSAGFTAWIGGHQVPASWVGGLGERRVFQFELPTGVAADAALTLMAGGSRWNFGPLGAGRP